MDANETTSSIWTRLWLDRSPPARKMAWQLCREFRDPRHVLDGFLDAGPSRDPNCQPPTSWQGSSSWHWKIAQSSGSLSDCAVKLLLENDLDERVESVVLLPKHGAKPSRERRLSRATACVSSQPGCGVGCPFCATGELGYRGNLSAEQIIEQVYLAGMTANRLGRRLRNVVFMGMGEPLHNAEAVAKSLEWLTHPRFFGLAGRHITVSTVGVPAAMKRLAQAFPDVRFALSLHAADHDLRRQLVPRAIHQPDVLRSMIREVNALQRAHPVWLEVVLLKGVNDSDECAQQLIEFCDSLRVEVNLIAYNDSPGASFQPTSRIHRERFAARLRDAQIRTTLRTSFGSNQAAACGQLSARPKNLHAN